MIIVLEQDSRKIDDKRFMWKPTWDTSRWMVWDGKGRVIGRKVWRLCWGMWSLSYYADPGLRDFFEHINDVSTGWVGGTEPYQHEKQVLLNCQKRGERVPEKERVPISDIFLTRLIVCALSIWSVVGILQIVIDIIDLLDS